MKFHHIGIVCKNIETAVNDYKLIHNNCNVSSIVFDELQDAKLCMVENADGSKIEFIEGSKFEPMLKKGISYYHICYSVKNINDEIEKLSSKGALLVSAAKPAILFRNNKVAFLYVSYGLIELLEN